MIFVKRQLTGGDVPLLEPISAATSPITDTVVHNPVAATVAIATVAAVVGVRHVCVGITASLATGATAQTPVHIFLRDGASTLGTIIWASVGAAPANSAVWWELPGLAIQGSINTAMTLEFEAAGVAASLESITLHYMDISETTK